VRKISHGRKGGNVAMYQKKVNCWEFMHCGRVYGGVMDGKYGICPASTEKRLHGMNHGKNAGRTCWVVSGTMCKDRIQGSYDFKFNNCVSCSFYQFVRNEEGNNFVASDALLRILEEQ